VKKSTSRTVHPRSSFFSRLGSQLRKPHNSDHHGHIIRKVTPACARLRGRCGRSGFCPPRAVGCRRGARVPGLSSGAGTRTEAKGAAEAVSPIQTRTRASSSTARRWPSMSASFRSSSAASSSTYAVQRLVVPLPWEPPHQTYQALVAAFERSVDRRVTIIFDTALPRTQMIRSARACQSSQWSRGNALRKGGVLCVRRHPLQSRVVRRPPRPRGRNGWSRAP